MTNLEKIAFLEKQKPKFKTYRLIYWSIISVLNLPLLPCLISYFFLSKGLDQNIMLIVSGSIVTFDLLYPLFNYFFVVLPLFGLKNIALMKEICYEAMPHEQRDPHGFFRVFKFRAWLLLIIPYYFLSVFYNWSWHIGWSLGRKQMLFADGIDIAIENLGTKHKRDDILEKQLSILHPEPKSSKDGKLVKSQAKPTTKPKPQKPDTKS